MIDFCAHLICADRNELLAISRLLYHDFEQLTGVSMEQRILGRTGLNASLMAALFLERESGPGQGEEA